MKETYIRFMAPVTPQTTDSLIKLVDDKIRNGYGKIHLLISSPGGSVFHGISLYNYLFGIPLEVDTYNFGSVDSIGVVLFCAGKNRYSVPNARFLIHGVSLNFQGSASFDEKMLDEQLKGLLIDKSNIARIIAFTTKKRAEDIEASMHNRLALNPEEAKEYGLVTEIKETLMPSNAEFYSIGEFDNPPVNVPTPFMFLPPGIQNGVKPALPLNENFTSLFDRGYTFTGRL